MGIGGFFKRGVREMMIARPDAAKGHLVYKHPDPTIPMKSQLTVQADEKAIFFRDGKPVGELSAGRHTLDSANIPFLSNLVDSFTGGNVFRAEVYFVTTREMHGNKFGGRIGNQQDPKSGMAVETMVYGTFSYRVTDPSQLVIGAVGLGTGTGNAFAGWIKEQLLKVIRDRIAELLVKNKWPLLDVTSGAYTEEIESEVCESMKAHLDSYGVLVVRLGNFVTSIDEEDEENLKKLYKDAAYLRMVGGTAGYQQFAAGKAMMGAGEGMAKGGGGGGGGGGGMLDGAGLGVGFGMAQMMARGAGMGAPAQQPAQTASSPAANTVQCGSCQAHVSPGKFCGQCGGSLASAPATASSDSKFCSNCGTKSEGDSRFCGNCGNKMA